MQSMAIRLKRSEEERALLTHELQKSQLTLQEKELQLLDAMGQLMTSQEQLTVISNATSRQLKHLSGQHQAALRLAHPSMDSCEKTQMDALKKIIEEQASLLLELSDENDALQEKLRAHERLTPDSTQQTRSSALTMFGSNK
ncbi:MAG TPA: hypothetical protein DDY37_00780 [Legionella sp.]|nr:hypothetical protein [Legionella sp.]